MNMAGPVLDKLGDGERLPGRNLPGESAALYRHLVRGDRTFPVEPPNWADDMMPENWGELDELLEDHLKGHPEERGEGTPSQILRDCINLMSPSEEGGEGTPSQILRDYINLMSPPEEDGE